MSEKYRLSFEFDNKIIADHFANWLCGCGEQDYWEWMRCREKETTEVITATSFVYYEKGQEFFWGGGRVIRTFAHRLDDPEDQ